MYAPDALRALMRPSPILLSAGWPATNATWETRGRTPSRQASSATGISIGCSRMQRVGPVTSSRPRAPSTPYVALFRQVVPGVTDDFYTSTGVIAQRFRLVSLPKP